MCGCPLDRTLVSLEPIVFSSATRLSPCSTLFYRHFHPSGPWRRLCRCSTTTHLQLTVNFCDKGTLNALALPPPPPLLRSTTILRFLQRQKCECVHVPVGKCSPCTPQTARVGTTRQTLLNLQRFTRLKATRSFVRIFI